MDKIDMWARRVVVGSAVVVVGGGFAFGVIRENWPAIVHWLASLDYRKGLEATIWGGCGSLAVLAIQELFSKLNRIQRLLTEIRDQRRWS